MAMDVGRMIGTAVGKTAREGAQARLGSRKRGRGGGGLSGGMGVAAGVGLATLVPVAAKAGKSLAKRGAAKAVEPVKNLGENVKDAIPGVDDVTDAIPGV